MIRIVIFLSLLALPALIVHAVEPEDHLAATEAWRAQRYANLKKPDGYLSYIGSGPVAVGESRVGSAPGNDIVLPAGPAHLGWLTLAADGRVGFRSEPGGVGRIHGEAFDAVELLDQLQDGGPTRIDFGSQWFYIVRLGELTAWRLRDTQSPLRLGFTDIDHYPVDPSWRIEADWEPFDPPRTLEYLTVAGTPDEGTVSGQATFERDGQRYTLTPTDADDGELFFVFADRTSGRTSYGGGRFLYARAPENGKVVLDFNRAYNPPCALNSHVVCPTAPPENRLRLVIEAGEKKPDAH